MSRLPDIKSVLSGIAGKDLKAPAIESPEGTRAWLEVSPMAQFFDLLDQAGRCRRLARDSADAKARDRFLEVAGECASRREARSGNPTAGPCSDD
jgi:hypothetical protein